MGDLFPSDLDENQDQANELVKIKSDVEFKTKMNFLLAHNGIRKNKFHMLIAPTHSGKSTMTRSILRDIVFNNPDKRILIWLTEETVNEFKEDFYEGAPAGVHFKNVKVSSQVGVEDDSEKIKKDIEQIIEHYNIDLVIIDNITTSNNLYQDVAVTVQSKTTTWLKNLTRTTTIFVIAHTNTSDFNNRLLDENDVRGGKSISNISQFLYVLQPIAVNDSLFQFILLKKHRGQKVENKFFRLSYDKITMSFVKDYSVTFDELKDIFKLRNKL